MIVSVEALTKPGMPNAAVLPLAETENATEPGTAAETAAKDEMVASLTTATPAVSRIEVDAWVRVLLEAEAGAAPAPRRRSAAANPDLPTAEAMPVTPFVTPP
ncbi:MAG TPA: hypothetical protein VNT25_02785 [Allosphingosinicella sp.]|nr:hypothetical protein [Allosphingosinicella sp.]